MAVAAALLAYAGAAAAQDPRVDTTPSVSAIGSQDALQVNYLTRSPIANIGTDVDYGLLFSDNRDLVGSAALLFHTNLNVVPHLRFNVGPQAYLAKLDTLNSGAFAVAISANARYELLPRYGVAAFGTAAYAPHVLMFGSARNITDFSAGAEVRFARHFYALGGYRWFNFKFPRGTPDDRIVNSVFVGLRWELGPAE